MSYPIEFKFPPTPQQTAIFDHLLDGEGSAIVRATAGAGKTTLLVQSCELLLASGLPADELLFLAFNKAIVEELKERLPKGVQAATMHSLGFGMLREALGSDKPDNLKYHKIIDEWLDDEGVRDYKTRRTLKASIKQLVDDIRMKLHEDMDSDSLLNLLEDTQPDYPKGRAGLITAGAKHALERGVTRAERMGEVDFTDMLWLPWKLDLRPKKPFKFVMLDEAQDQSQLQRWIFLRSMAPGGRALVVGDPEQTIFTFAGAVRGNMDELAEILDAERFPLSVTWRCPKSHVALAQLVVGGDAIQAAPSAKEGKVGELSQAQFEQQVKPGDLVMSRTNQPLVAQAFAFIRAKKRVKIRGRDIGQGLIRTLQGIEKNYMGRTFSSEALLAGIKQFFNDKESALFKREDLSDEQRADRLEQLADQESVLTLITEEADPKAMSDVTSVIENLFDDNLGDFILLSTVHKAKGLEFNDTYIINPSKMPAPFGDAESEKCVLFVALTRGKEGLYFVDGLPDHEGIRNYMAEEVDSYVA